MGNDSIIPVGNNRAAEYVAYGDDCQYDDIIVFSFVVIRRYDIGWVERRIDVLKEYFNIPKDVPLHCRVLFSGDARRKAGLCHLKSEDAQAIVSRCVRIINQCNIIVRYAFARISNIKTMLGDEIELEHYLDGHKIKHSVNHDPKGMLGHLMNMSLLVAPDGSQGPTTSDCELFVAEDHTKVRFIGDKKQKAHSMYSGFSDVGASEGKIFQNQPTIIKSTDAPLLQLADVSAYLCAHALSDKNKDILFRNCMKRIQLRTSGEWCLTKPP